MNPCDLCCWIRLEKLQPKNIAVNFSKNDVHADGLSYGMYQLLLEYLHDTPWEKRLVSAERIIACLAQPENSG